MNIDFQIQGMDRVLGEFAALADRLPHEVAKGIWEIGNNIMNDSQSLVPVDTGALRASGHVGLPVISGGEAKVVIGYGGPAGSGNFGGASNTVDVGYALAVHENLQSHHEVGQAKYLEAAAVQWRPKATEYLRSVLHDAISVR